MIDQHNSLAEKFLKKGFWLYFFTFIVAPFGYIVKIIISGELNVEDIGIIYGVMSLMVLLSSFNDFGMTESLNKFIPHYITEKQYDKVKTALVYALGTQLITGAIIFFLFYFGSDYLAINYFKDIKSAEIIKIFSFFFLGTNIFHVIQTFFQAIQNTFLQKITELFRMIIVLGYTIFLFLSHNGSLFSYSLSWIIGLYVGIGISIFIFYQKYYKIYLKDVKIIWSKKLYIEIFKYAIIVFIASQASTILSQIDMQMIIYLLGNKDAGYYTNYLSIVSIPVMILGPIFGLIFPVFSEMFAKKQTDKIILVKEILTKNFLVISFAFDLLFFVFAKNIAVILFGEKFLTSGVILQWSVLFLSFNFLLQINFAIFAAIGKVTERLKIILIAIVFNTIGNIVLIKLMGVAGSALATGFGWILIYVLAEIKLKKYRIKLNFKPIIKNFVFLSVIGAFLYFFINPLLTGLTRVEGCLWLVLISTIYFGLFTMFNYKEFKFFINEVKMLRNKN